jgi:hypothetical protein
VVAILAVDQVIKIWVKTNMSLHEVIPVFDWFKIVFIENNGMAYGMEIGSKIALSLFRIVAICWLTWYIIRQVRQDAKTGYIVCMVMVLAGASLTITSHDIDSRMTTNHEKTQWSVFWKGIDCVRRNCQLMECTFIIYLSDLY